MIHVRCVGCQGAFEVDERRIPKSGMRVRCSKCGGSFHVTPSGDASAFSPAAKQPFGDDLPAPGRSAASGATQRGGGGADLPALAGSRGITDLPARAGGRPPVNTASPALLVDDLDLPAPGSARGVTDLPAPAVRSRLPPPASAPTRGVADLPAPAAPRIGAPRPPIASPAGHPPKPPPAPPSAASPPDANPGGFRVPLPSAPPMPDEFDLDLPVAIDGIPGVSEPPSAPSAPKASRFSVADAAGNLPSVARSKPTAPAAPAPDDFLSLSDPALYAAPPVGLDEPLPTPSAPELPKGGPALRRIGTANLPAAKPGGDLPASGRALGRVALEKRAVPIGSSDELPAPANAHGLPAPAGHAGLPAAASSIDLPISSVSTGLPTPASAPGLPSAATSVALPSMASVTAPPVPANVSALPASRGAFDEASEFGELDLNGPTPVATTAPSKVVSLSPPQEPEFDLPLPPLPSAPPPPEASSSERPRPKAGGGIDFGEISLGIDEEPGGPPPSSGEGEEFDQIPLEQSSSAPRVATPALRASTPPREAAKPQAPTAAPRTSSGAPRLRANRALYGTIAAGALVLIGGASPRSRRPVHSG